MDQLEAVIYKFPMSGKLASATEETGATPVEADISLQQDTKSSDRDFLKAARRDLTPDEAASAAGIRWFQYDLERLDKQCSSLSRAVEELRSENLTLAGKYHDQRVELETLRGKNGISIRNEVLSNLSLSSGSVGIGAAASFVTVPAVQTFAIFVLIVSCVLTLGGIVLRMWK